MSGYNDLDVGTAISRSVTGLSAGTNYWYRVRAVNGSGTSGNSSSQPVTTGTSPPVTTISPATQTVTSAAQSYSITVTSNTSWIAFSNQSWATVLPASGTNNGSVTVTVTANTGTTARNATITIGGQPHSLTQSVMPVADVGAAHSLSPAAYVAGSTVSLTANFSYPTDRSIQSLLWRPQLPPGWTITGVSGDGGPELGGGEVLFLAGNITQNPVQVTAVITVPAGQSGEKTLSSEFEYQLNLMVNPATVRVSPDPLTVPQQLYHNADFRTQFWVIDGTEMNRVLSYWRAGAYSTSSETPDGFAAGAGSRTRNHSADFRDTRGVIDGTEMNRVLSYWRAGAYHVNSEGPDGYAAGTSTGGLSTMQIASDFGTQSEPFTAAHSVPATYTPGQPLSVSVTLSYSGNLLSLLVRPEVPPGWTIQNVTGTGNPEYNFGEALWLGSIPASPIQMNYEIVPPVGAAGTVNVRNHVEYQLTGQINPVAVQAAPNPAVLSPGTSTEISPVSRSIDHTAQSYPITVTSNTTWAASSNQTWATVSPTSGSGNDTVTVTVTTNSGTTARDAIITIGGQNHSLTQAGVISGNPSPLYHYSFDDTLAEKNTLLPSAGTSGSISYVDGPRGKALRLNNHSSYGTLPAVNFAGMSATTVACWVREESVLSDGTYYCFWGDEFSGSKHLGIGHTDGNLNFGPDPAWMAYNSNWLNEWTHYALVHTETTSAIYVNGIKIKEVQQTGSKWKSNATGYIGGHRNSQYGFFLDRFQGAVDDLMIFDRALSASEIATIAGVETPPAYAYFLSNESGSNQLWRGTLEADGISNRQQLTQVASPGRVEFFRLDPARSRIGLVIFSGTQSADGRFYWMTPDGTGLTQVSDFPAGGPFALSLDGTQAVMAKGVNDPGGNVNEAYIMNTSTGATTLMLDASQPRGSATHKTWFEWLPNGKILFSDTLVWNDYAGQHDIHLWDAGTVTPLASNTAQGDATPLLSPDGTKLLVSHYAAGGGTHQISYIQWPADTGRTVILPWSSQGPSANGWLDNETVLFQESGELYSMALDGTGRTNLTNTSGVNEFYMQVWPGTTSTPSSNADLSNLALSAGTLSPAFSSAITTYTADVANAVSSITVTPTAVQANATISVRVNGSSYASVASGSPSGALALNVGGNAVDVRVTAQDGTTIKTYTVTVTRAAPLSNNADLSNLALSSGTLNPAFSSTIISYTASVANAVSSITVTPTAAQANATISVRVNGSSYVNVTSGSASGALALNVGGNTVDLRVTAQDGTTIKTYSVTVTRAAPLSNNADLSNLALSSGTLNPAFSSATISYTASVANAVSSITVTPTAAQANATIAVRVNGGSYASVTSGSASGALALNVGGNAVDVRVTAQDGITTKTYTVNVTREAPSNAPDWQTPVGLENSMTLYGQVENAGVRIESAGSLLAVFENGQVAGVGGLVNGPAGLFYNVTVWSNQTSAANLPLKVYDAASGEVLDIAERVNFTVNSTVGGISAPQLFTVQPPVVEQQIPLVTGWNWVSFNALPDNRAVSQVLAGYTPQNNDVIKGVAGTTTYFGGSWFPADFQIQPGRMYMLRRQQTGGATLSVTGPPADAAQNLGLVAGWNWLGYVPQDARNIALALSRLTLANNDVLKSQQDGSATWFGSQWFPNTAVMQSGRGYLLRLTQAQSFSFDEAAAGAGGMMAALAMDEEFLAASTGSAPAWQAPAGKENSATLYAAAQVSGQPVTADGSLLAIFEGQEVAGVAGIMNGPAGRLFQVTVWSDQVNVPGMTLKVYDAATGQTHDLEGTLAFVTNGLTGQINAPVVFEAVRPPVSGGNAPSGPEFARMVSGPFKKISLVPGEMTTFLTANAPDEENAQGTFTSTWGTGRGRTTVNGQWSYERTDADTANLEMEYLLGGSSWREVYATTFISRMLTEGTFYEYQDAMLVDSGPFSQAFLGRPAREEEEIVFGTPLRIRVGERISISVSGSQIPAGAKVLAVSGLPVGLRFDAALVSITGQAQKLQPAKAATIRYKDADGKTKTVQFDMLVEALPITSLGTYAAIVDRSDANFGLGGLLTMSATTTGSCTGSLRFGAVTYRFKGSASSTLDEDEVVAAFSLARKGDTPMQFEVTLRTDDILTGIVSLDGVSTPLNGWRQTWGKGNPVGASHMGTFNVLSDIQGVHAGKIGTPQGSGYAVLKVTASGAAALSGKLSDGTTFTQSLPLGPGGQVGLALPLYKSTGSVQGIGTLSANGLLTGDVTWVKLPQASLRERLYREGFGHDNDGPVELALTGARWIRGVSALQAGVVEFSEGGVGASTGPVPDIGFTILTNGKIQLGIGAQGHQTKFSFNNGTGLFSGSFRLLDDNPEKPGKPLPRTVKYQGILVPGADPQGGGWFLLPQLAEPPQTKATTSPILSGKVTVD